jgi:hypothetical protein
LETEAEVIAGRIAGCRDMMRCVDDLVVNVEVGKKVVVGDREESLEVERQAFVGYFGVLHMKVGMQAAVGYFVEGEKLGYIAYLASFEQRQVIVEVDLAR